MRRVTDGEGGRGEGGSAAPLASHPLQEGPGLLHSALALLLKFQLCVQPSWLAASHVPALGWALGSGARGGHMDKEPGSAEPRAGHPLGPGMQMLPGPAQPCPLHSMEDIAPGLHKYPGSAYRWGLVLGTAGATEITWSSWPKPAQQPGQVTGLY